MTATRPPETHSDAPGPPTGGPGASTVIDTAENARYWIEEAGGLASKQDLARRWNVSRQRVRDLEAKPDFPKPLGWVNGRPAYALLEVEAWRRERQTQEQS